MIDTAMILAAGRGERMRPLTDAMPKPLLPVAGKPMLEHTLARLKAHGIVNIVVNAHHFAEQIVDRVKGRARVIVEDRLLDTECRAASGSTSSSASASGERGLGSTV